MNTKDVIFLLTGIWAFGIGIRLSYELAKGDFVILSFPLSFILDWIPLCLLGGTTISIIIYDNIKNIREKLNDYYVR